MLCFLHFGFATCFAYLRATTPYTFSKTELPKVLREWCILRVLTSRGASRHNGVHFSTSQLPRVLRPSDVLTVLLPNLLRASSRQSGMQFFISRLPGWLRTRRFSKPTFRPSGATNHWKNSVFRDFPTFSCTFIFFDLLSSSFLFSDSSHICFSICPYCRKFDFQTSFDNEPHTRRLFFLE